MSSIHQVAGSGAPAGPSSTNNAGSHASHNTVSEAPSFSTQLVRAMDTPLQKLTLTKSSSSSTSAGSHGTSQGAGALQLQSAKTSHSSAVDSSHVSGHDFYERALRLLSHRQELLASNIANADTPGYKAMDIEVGEALRKGLDKDSVSLKYYVPNQGSVDGNTVEMDVERAKFMENAIRYEFAVSRVRDHYMMMSDLLKNTPY